MITISNDDYIKVYKKYKKLLEDDNIVEITHISIDNRGNSLIAYFKYKLKLKNTDKVCDVELEIHFDESK